MSDLTKSIITIRFIQPSELTVVVDHLGVFQNTNFDPTQFPFDVEGYLHFEPATSHYKYGENFKKQLSDDQITKLQEFIATLPVEMDLSYPCYNKDRSNLYMGVLPLSEITEKGYVHVNQNCEYPLAVYTDSGWEKVKAIFTSDGSLILDPDSYCDSCEVFLTEAQWNEFPKAEGFSDSAVLKYDFENKEWVDTRGVASELEELRVYITSAVERVLLTKLNKLGVHLGGTYFHFNTIEELTTYKTYLETLAGTTTIVKDNKLVCELFSDIKTIDEATAKQAVSAELQDVVDAIEQLSTLKQEMEKFKALCFSIIDNCEASDSFTVEKIDVLKQRFDRYVTDTFEK